MHCHVNVIDYLVVDALLIKLASQGVYLLPILLWHHIAIFIVVLPCCVLVLVRVIPILSIHL